MEGIENVSIKNDSRIESCLLPKDGEPCSSVQLKTGENYSCQLLVSLFYDFIFTFRNFMSLEISSSFLVKTV